MLKRGAQAIAVTLVAAMLGLLIWKIATQEKAKAKTGKQAPGFTLERLDRPGTLTLDSFAGKAVVVNFWASWCAPCRDEAPLFEAAWKRWRSHGLVVVGIDGSDDFTGDARRFMRKHGLTYPAGHDRRYAAVTDYGVTGYPETFFIGRRGKLVGHVPGQVSKSTLASGIRRALR